jgi:hypothetical protein
MSICQYVNDMEEDLQNSVKTTSKLLTASYTTRSNWPKDLVKLCLEKPIHTNDCEIRKSHTRWRVDQLFPLSSLVYIFGLSSE